mgnify:CR=1 FL=1
MATVKILPLCIQIIVNNFFFAFRFRFSSFFFFLKIKFTMIRYRTRTVSFHQKVNKHFFFFLKKKVTYFCRLLLLVRHTFICVMAQFFFLYVAVKDRKNFLLLIMEIERSEYLFFITAQENSFLVYCYFVSKKNFPADAAIFLFFYGFEDTGRFLSFFYLVLL